MNRTFSKKQFANAYPGYTSTGTWESFEQSRPSEANNLAIKVGIELDKRYDIDTELITKKEAINQINAITMSTGYMNPAPYSIEGYEGIYDVINNGDIVFFGRRVNESNYTPSWDRIIIIVNFESNKVTSFMLTPGHWTMGGEDYIYGNCKSETIDLSRLGKFDTSVIDADYLDSAKKLSDEEYYSLYSKFCHDVLKSRISIHGTDITDSILNQIKSSYNKYYEIIINDYPELLKYWIDAKDPAVGLEVFLLILIYRAKDYALSSKELSMIDNMKPMCDYNLLESEYLAEYFIYHLLFYGGDNTNTYLEYFNLINSNNLKREFNRLTTDYDYVKGIIEKFYGYNLQKDYYPEREFNSSMSKNEFLDKANLKNVSKKYPKLIDALYEDVCLNESE